MNEAKCFQCPCESNKLGVSISQGQQHTPTKWYEKGALYVMHKDEEIAEQSGDPYQNQLGGAGLHVALSYRKEIFASKPPVHLVCG